jgi:dTDP-4-dehydrorhamnose 3,5-epimerase
MEFKELNIAGVYEIKNFTANDNRGVFVKTFHEDQFTSLVFNGKFAESYYSQSVQNVIRGMHFQLPSNEHKKLVYVTEGKILDVILDLRKSSSTFRKYISVELHQFWSSVLIPNGCARGFLTLSKTATVVNNVTKVYNPKSDSGILWNSFEFDWGINNPIMSDRDQVFDSF